MASRKRASFVALPTLLQRRFPHLVGPYEAITNGRVLVDGALITNLASRVRADASLRLLGTEELRGTRKLQGALESFDLTVRDVVALDLGAAAGGFTQALLNVVQRGSTRSMPGRASCGATCAPMFASSTSSGRISAC